MSTQAYRHRPGPFVADQLSDGDRYELSNGHPIYCAPAGREQAASIAIGARALATDPDAEWTGIDAGFSPEPGELRAPDIVVGKIPDTPPDGKGWIPGAPPLAVEYAGHGQDEAELREKIAEFLAAGTRWVWVVRLVGPRRVEVHAPNAPIRVVGVGEQLEAPGILRNPVPVEALFDHQAADRAALRNLLQRHGYESLEEVRNEGRVEGRAEGRAEGARHGQALAVLHLLESRGVSVTPGQRARILDCTDEERLKAWLLQAAGAGDLTDLLPKGE